MGIVNLTNTQCGFSNFLCPHDFRVTKCIVGNRRSGLELPNFIPIPVKLTMPYRPGTRPATTRNGGSSDH
jgi:hypothetical protein